MVQCQECGLQVCVCGKAYEQFTPNQLVDLITQATRELGERAGASPLLQPHAHAHIQWIPLTMDLLDNNLDGWRLQLSQEVMNELGLNASTMRYTIRGKQQFDQTGFGDMAWTIYGSNLHGAIQFCTGEKQRYHVGSPWVDIKHISVSQRQPKRSWQRNNHPPLTGEDFDALTGGLSGMFKQPRRSQEELDKLYDEVCKSGAKFKFEVRPGEWCYVVDVLRTESPSGNLWTQMDVLIFNPHAGPDVAKEVEATITVIREPEAGKTPENGYVTLDSIEMSNFDWSPSPTHDNRGLVRRTIGQVKGFFSDNSGMKPGIQEKFKLLQVPGTQFKLDEGFIIGAGIENPAPGQLFKVGKVVGLSENDQLLSLEVEVHTEAAEAVTVPVVVALYMHPKSCLRETGMFLDVDKITIVE